MDQTSQLGRANGDLSMQTHEPLNVVDGTTKTERGIILSKPLVLFIFVIFVLTLVTSSLLVYNFAACPKTDQLANVTKYELCRVAEAKLSLNETNKDIPKDRNIEANDKKSATERNIAISKNEIEKVKDAEGKDVMNDTNLETPKEFRLPQNVKPENYYLNITPFFLENNFTFQGEVTILLTVFNETNEIIFHGVDLVFRDLKLLTEKDRRIIDILKTEEDKLRQFHTVTVRDKLEVGMQYLLVISYSGVLNDDLHGFYRSSYEDGGVRKWIAVTQFQAMDARRAFPCWDEPAMKARFTITIGRPANMTSLSNMNSIKQSPHDSVEGYINDFYEESLPMSTYLVAFAVTDFSSKSKDTFSVWARHKVLPAASFALEIGSKILKFLENYYDIKFPLPKIDMIALPDFKNGAMENWGLLTFREIAMLYQQGVSATMDKVHVATVVAHEIAHQWFGNLVTPSWWRDLWLNEGFATYVEYVAVDAVEKSWNLTELCILDQVHNVFQLDALNSSHQLSVDVTASEETDAIFDKISYGKGAALLRMLNHILTDDIFNAGVTNYLKSKMYGNAEQKDLWAALTAVATQRNLKIDVAVVMDSWTLQTGFPVLTVNRDYGNQQIKFSQERFVLINETSSSQQAPLWWIPVSYTTASEQDFRSTRPKFWLEGVQSVVKDFPVKNEDWLIVNIQETGFYRVNYDTRNWQLLTAVLNDKNRFQEIHVINRAQIVDDAMNLALTGRLDYKTALDVVSYLAHERSYVPWKAGLSALGYIDTMLSNGEHYVEYGIYVDRLLQGAIRDVGWDIREDESVITAQHRVDLWASACHFENSDCIQNAIISFKNWSTSPDPDRFNDIPVDVRGIVYCMALRLGGVSEWQFALDRLPAAAPAERHRLLSVLGCTRTPHLLRRYLDMSLRNDSGIRKQDVVRVFSAVSNTAIGQPISFSFIRENWQNIRTYFGSISTLNHIVKVVTRRLNLQHEYEELKRFVSESCSDLGRPVRQVLETVHANVQWRNRNYQTIVDWLQEVNKKYKA
ncbi:aminopeptidase N [Bombyx mori]|uniref:Aminopeptidase N n=1 Tax=Bombyx mori TaxID=7091 RepID=A0A8R2LYX5_BOMMO|nr:aminopeptidase N [Bombyx mori]